MPELSQEILTEKLRENLLMTKGVAVEAWKKISPRMEAKTAAVPKNELHIRGLITMDETAKLEAWLFGDENLVTPSKFKEQLSNCDADITMRIDCPGGTIRAASTMCDALMQYKKDNPGMAITAVIEGMSGSAATLLQVKADKVQMAEFAEMMIHRSHMTVKGNGLKMEKTAKRMLANDETYAAAYAAKTGKKDAEMLSLMTEETYFTAKQALEIGFVDEILANEQKDDGEMQETADSPAMTQAELEQSEDDALAYLLEIPATTGVPNETTNNPSPDK